MEKGTVDSSLDLLKSINVIQCAKCVSVSKAHGLHQHLPVPAVLNFTSQVGV